jgi:hypothetical protein
MGPEDARQVAADAATFEVLREIGDRPFAAA